MYAKAAHEGGCGFKTGDSDMSQQFGAAGARLAPGFCEEKARLESRYQTAKDAFETARSVIRRKVGKSSQAEFLRLDREVDLAWDRLQDAMRELAAHTKEHGCGTSPDTPPARKPVW
jgi:hypothetical protein